MRIEVENNRMTLDEFVVRLEAASEPFDLTRDGTVVATVVKTSKRTKTDDAVPSPFAGDSKRAEAATQLKKLVEKAHTNAKKHGLNERQAVRLAVNAVEKVRKQNAAARGR